MGEDRELRLARVLRSLEGLSVGDAFGEAVLRQPDALTDRFLSRASPWKWSDDTAMAASVAENLAAHGRIEPDSLAMAFAERYRADPRRGYGHGARALLQAIAAGQPWREAGEAMFPGGSYGNGGAMRAAPVGAWFADDPARAGEEGDLASLVTHAHPEGRAGGRAVAVAAALAASPSPPRGPAFLLAVRDHLPRGEIADLLEIAARLPPDDPALAAAELGNGQQITAQDTVPFCLWIAAHYLDDYEAALWATISALGDGDTNCAIVGGIVALRAPAIPQEWLDTREALPQLRVFRAGRG